MLSRLVPRRPGWTFAVLSRCFRFGLPLLVVLSALGIVPWWLVLIPVSPVWFSFVTSLHDANERARMIRRPRRRMSLDESVAERKFLFADTRATEAAAERIGALQELTRARTVGEKEAASLRKRSRACGARARGWDGPPADC